MSTLAYTRYGSGEPLIACHALAFSKQFFVDAQEALGQKYDVVAVDLRGHGESPAFDDDSTLQALALELDEVLEEVGWSEAIFGGISLGAATVLSYALQKPERVKGLIQDLPAFSPTSAMADERAATIASVLASGDTEGALSAIAANLPKTVGKALTDDLRERWKRYENLEPRLATAFEAIRRFQVTDQWPEALAELHMPTHVFGLMGDKSHPIQIATEMTRWLRQASLYDRAPTLNPADGVRAWSRIDW